MLEGMVCGVWWGVWWHFTAVRSSLDPWYVHLFHIVTTGTNRLSQTLQDFWTLILIVFDAADEMLLIVRQPFIKQLMVLANIHANQLLPHTPKFNTQHSLMSLLAPQLSKFDAQCSVMPLLAPQLSPETVCLVSQYDLLPKWRLTFSPGLPTGQGSLNMMLWISWRFVLAVAIFFLAVFLVAT